MARQSITWDDKALMNKLMTVNARASNAIYGIMGRNAPRIAGTMRSSAPWTDRTGNARSGLFAEAFRNGTNFGIHLGHRVAYGIWLEVRFSGRYAVIGPTIQREGPAVMGELSRLFAILFGSK